jgi:hypothetical protein
MIINLLVGCLINISCHLDSLPNDNARRSNTCNEHYKWDNANLYDFYYASSSFFDHFSVDCYYACSLGFDCNGHHHSIDNLYKDIVHALQQAERLTVYEYFIWKEPTQLWKCWHNKFSRVAI